MVQVPFTVKAHLNIIAQVADRKELLGPDIAGQTEHAPSISLLPLIGEVCQVHQTLPIEVIFDQGFISKPAIAVWQGHAVIYQEKCTVSQKTRHAAKRFQRVGFLS